MGVYTPPKLKSICIFDTHSREEDCEEDQILYFWPPTEPLNSQIRYIGLFQAMSGFTRYKKPTYLFSSLSYDTVYHASAFQSHLSKLLYSEKKKKKIGNNQIGL